MERSPGGGAELVDVRYYELVVDGTEICVPDEIVLEGNDTIPFRQIRRLERSRR
jgi:hypothetical protein